MALPHPPKRAFRPSTLRHGSARAPALLQRPRFANKRHFTVATNAHDERFVAFGRDRVHFVVVAAHDLFAPNGPLPGGLTDQGEQGGRGRIVCGVPGLNEGVGRFHAVSINLTMNASAATAAVPAALSYFGLGNFPDQVYRFLVPGAGFGAGTTKRWCTTCGSRRAAPCATMPFTVAGS
jgi:hypothetical protein